MPDGALNIDSACGRDKFDAVIATTAPTELIRICPDLPGEYRRLEKIKYEANLCLQLELARGLSLYYWILVADNSVPFVAVIEHTNLAPLPGSAAYFMYLSRYLDPEEILFSRSGEEIKNLFIAALKGMFPELQEGEIMSARLYRARYAQPVMSVGYLDVIPRLTTPIANLYLACMAQIYPQDRGQSYAVKIAREVN